MSSPLDAPWFLAETAEDYPTLAHTRLHDEDVYIVSSPAVIVNVFIEHGRHTMKGQDLTGRPELEGAFRAGEGESHMRHRRLAQPAFHADRLREYAADIVEMTCRHTSTWRDGDVIDMQQSMASLCLVNMARALFGAPIHDASADLAGTLDAIIDGLGDRMLLGRAGTDVDPDNRAQGDMLSLLLASEATGFGYADVARRDVAVRAVLSDPEPTAVNLSWAWLLLAQNPHVAAWMCEEIDALLGRRLPSASDLISLPRTRAVLAEAMRLYPPAWVQGRRLVEAVEVDGWLIPAGTLAMASQFALHRSPAWWASPEDFRPARWIASDGTFSEDAPGQPRGAWFPFGTGGRRCIGERLALMEASLVLATVARRWAPEVAPGVDIRPWGGLTLRAEGGIPMTLRER
jgi:cytochrome P450